MVDEFIEKIQEYTKSQPTSNLCTPTSKNAINETEHKLGFSIPNLLKQCYLRVGNGGFGPGYGVIGLEGGYASDYGNVVETFQLLKSDQESEGLEWQEGLLPFCEWGCNIFSCVDCNDPQHPVFTFEDFAVTQQNYTLDRFFELWMSGADILSCDGAEVDEVEITNPFTGEKETVSKRRQK
ncbi:SMI1/KNR4 family protein [Gimesia fumaroli]|uniref:SMI1 / KNR4 family protein n=1 Tax=Gimesia fumaroli TaxID=2527976 RepID=A0A518I558_9PLAN|nr:SMI1/KNR4 family protein [Gimesia fumaroli]QDV48207.1 SMI1 / KNR4 family protein [Gimesia fumaroli]